MSAFATEANHHRSTLVPGATLQDRYRIVRQLGKGGMGAVYEAVDQRLDTTVALKETFAVDAGLRRQFEQEARLLAQLNHPALPRVSDYFTEGDRAFLVMQFITGIDLNRIIATQPGPFPRPQVIAWADQLLDALIYLHTRERQIIHRDIKPHNLKLSSDGQIALLDFGLAKAQASDVSTVSSGTSIFGYTRRYAPLEQMRDEGTTPQSDIYALGATLYHLLTGVKPPDALARASALDDFTPDPLKPADEIHPTVGGEISEILSRAMALLREDRFQSAEEFREALRRVGRKQNEIDLAQRAFAPGLKSDSIAASPVSKNHNVRSNDPFESYSILKPDDLAWLAPKDGRRLGVSVAILAIFLLGSVGAFYKSDHWLDTTHAVVDLAKTNSVDDHNNATITHQSKSDSGNSSSIESHTPASVPGTERRKEPPRHSIHRPDNTHLKPPPVVLPPW